MNLRVFEESPLVPGAAQLWHEVEAAYLCAWSALEPTGPYAEFIDRWSNPQFARYVQELPTIAGSDPSGGAGLQADLKTFHQHSVFGTSVVTLLTVQNTQAVSAVEILKADFVLGQLDAVLKDIPPKAAKAGALGSAAIIETIAERAERHRGDGCPRRRRLGIHAGCYRRKCGSARQFQFCVIRPWHPANV